MKKLSLIFIAILFAFITHAQTKETIFFENFESGWGSWWADNGVWDVGIPTVGPENAHSGQNCAGTVLDGNYPDNANTRLISPSIVLPSPSGEETIQLKFWQWFNIEKGDDQGLLQISENSGPWETISIVEFDGGNPAWTQYVADLTSYAGSSIRIGFYFTSDNYLTYQGWYIDDLRIEGIIGVGINEHTKENASIYPNPFSYKTTIEFNNPDHINYKLSVFNITGQKVFEMDNITNDKVELKKGNLKPGIYMIELNGKMLYRGKIAVK